MEKIQVSFEFPKSLRNEMSLKTTMWISVRSSKGKLY